MSTSSSSSSTSADVNANRIAHLADTTKTEQQKNMLAFFESGKYTDVILQAGGKEFRAHKLILAANSPVFAAMFYEENTSEAVKNRVDIEDMSADVLQQMLSFIYTGQVQKMEMYASELLSVACKFQLDILKSYCDRYLVLTHRSTFSVTRLPEQALLCVFKQLPLIDQMSARKVCVKWARLVLKATCQLRFLNLLVGPGDMVKIKSQYTDHPILNLLVNEDGTPMFPACRHLTDWNWLQYDMLNDDVVNEMIGTFTGINKLAVVINGVQALHYLANLLDGWSAQLVSFELVDFLDEENEEDFDYQLSDSQVNQFYGAINRLTALKHLKLGFHSLPLRDLPILSQLEQLEFYSNNVTNDVFAEMLQYNVPVNSALTRICYKCSFHNFDEFTSLSEQLRNRLGLLITYPTVNELATLCTAFQFLTSLYLDPPRITFRQLFRHLANLQQLIHLALLIDFPNMPVDNLGDIPLPQVKSVKALQLELENMNAHLDLAQMNIGWTIPNVQVIQFSFFYYYECTQCGIDKSCDMQANLDTFKACFRQLFRPLKHDCTKLRKIVHNFESDLGTVEELLAE